MALSGIITKTQFANEFNSRVKNAIVTGIVWHSGNIPSTIGGDGAPATAPSSDFGSSSFSSFTDSDISGSVITASDVINAIVKVCTEYTRIRNYKIEWYTTGNKNALAGSTSNISKVFLQVLFQSE